MNLHRHNTRKMMPDGDPAGGGTPPANTFTYGDEHKDYVATKGWKGIDDVITSNKNLETLVGADKANRGVIWPKDDQDTDGWKAIHSKLGVPEKVEDYGLAAAEGEDGTFVKEFAGWAAANKLTKGAAGALLTNLREYVKTQGAAAATAAEAKATQEMQALETEWGSAATANKELARRFAGELGITAEQSAAIESAMGTAAFMRMMQKGGAKLGEQKPVSGDGKSGFGTTQADARAQLNQARTDRLANKINEADFQALVARLGPIAEPGQSAAA